jgi:hypothetical protein
MAPWTEQKASVRQERWKEAMVKGSRRRLYEGRGVKETVSKEGESHNVAVD